MVSTRLEFPDLRLIKLNWHEQFDGPFGRTPLVARDNPPSSPDQYIEENMGSEFETRGFVGVGPTVTVPSVIIGALKVADEKSVGPVKAGDVLAAPSMTLVNKRKLRSQNNLRRLQKKNPWLPHHQRRSLSLLRSQKGLS